MRNNAADIRKEDLARYEEAYAALAPLFERL